MADILPENPIYQKIILIITFSYILFFHIKDNEYMKMLGLSLITGIISYQIKTKKDVYEGVDDSMMFTEADENVRRTEQAAEEAREALANAEAALADGDGAVAVVRRRRR